MLNFLRFSLVALVVAGGVMASAQPAQLVFRGGHVVTLASSAPSTPGLAVRDGRIVAIGAEALDPKWVGPATRVVDLGGQALLPGFIDAHGHITLSAQVVDMANVAPPPVGPVSSIAALREALEAHRDERGIPPGQWVLGFGYDDSLLEERRHPTRADLDDLFPEQPVALIHVSGHLGVLNTRGLELAEFSAGMPDPDGGVIRREPGTDQPNGVLEENAFFRIYGILPRPSLEQSLASLVAGPRPLHLVRHHHGAGRRHRPELAATAARGGPTGPVARRCFRVPTGCGPAGRPGRRARVRFAMKGRLEIGGVKLMLDGSPQGKTAYPHQALSRAARTARERRLPRLSEHAARTGRCAWWSVTLSRGIAGARSRQW